MQHDDHVYLLKRGVPNSGGIWADLGSGTGAFTLALADLLGPEAVIYSVDKDRGALREQERAMRARFPATTLHYVAADFTRPLDLPPLDGVLMANSPHFVRDKDAVVQLVRSYVRPGGRLVLVEYNTDRGNIWVPTRSLMGRGRRWPGGVGLPTPGCWLQCPAAFWGRFTAR